MKINIKKLTDLGGDVNDYIEKKFESLAKFLKHFEEAREVEVRLEIGRTSKHHKKGEVFQAVASVELPKKILRADAYGEDIRTAIDEARDTLRSEIEKYKTQFVELHKKKLAK